MSFTETPSKTIQVFNNGELVSTTSRDNAIQQFGYKPAAATLSVATSSSASTPKQSPPTFELSTSSNSTLPQNIQRAPVGQLTSATTIAPLAVSGAAKTNTPTGSDPIKSGLTSGLSKLQQAFSPGAPTSKLAANLSVSQAVKNDIVSLANTNSKISAANVATTKGGYIYPVGTKVDPVQCVSLVGALRPDVGTATGNWTKGVDVATKDQNGAWTVNPTLQPGTPIATFMRDGSYPGPQNNYLMDRPRADGAKPLPHAAIYEGPAIENGKVVGMKVLEQYQGQPARETIRRFDQVGYTYSVVDIKN